ncbi:MAG: hypothetical protein R3C59_31275 [Planctomycetaceae bacterium]
MTESRPVIEIGVIVAGPLESVDRQAVHGAVTDVVQTLQMALPSFDWRFRTVRRDEWSSSSRIEPTELLRQAREERDEYGWDFAFVMTHADLISHYKPFALAATSSALDVAVISTARIDPRAIEPESTDDERSARIQQRLGRLLLHSFGHWLGLNHHDDPDNAMHDIASINDLSTGQNFSRDQCEAMQSVLNDIADQRLEERDDLRRASLTRFCVLAAWENRDEILGAIVQAKPWEFPTRLSRLTTAAVSTVLILLMTAETWDMAMSQSGASMTGLFLFSIVGTTAYVGVRQQLFLRRNGRRITEQIVTSNTAAAAIVATGMFVMFLLLSILTVVAGWLLFPSDVVNGWVASIHKPIRLRHYLLLATTVGSLGIVIGALGASFEQHHHFRHVVFVDEEV